MRKFYNLRNHISNGKTAHDQAFASFHELFREENMDKSLPKIRTKPFESEQNTKENEHNLKLIINGFEGSYLNGLEPGTTWTNSDFGRQADFFYRGRIQELCSGKVKHLCF